MEANKKNLTGRREQYMPLIATPCSEHVACSRCRYVNPQQHTFCTSCGFVLAEENLPLYQQRQQQRQMLLEQAENVIRYGRISLYILSLFFLLFVGVLFGWKENNTTLLLTGVTIAAFFFLLAKWSLLKPFSALLTGFIVVITLSVVIVFSELAAMHREIPAFSEVAAGLAFNFLLFRGVQGAYRADLLSDEMNPR